MLTGNKGEWSEVYALLMMVSERRLYSASGDNERDLDRFFPLLTVVKKETGGNKIVFSFDRTPDFIRVSKNGEFKTDVTAREVADEAEYLFNEIRAPHPDPSFPVERTEYFISRFGCESIKASSTEKADVAVVMHDIQTGFDTLSAFSIKSQAGGPSTLLNATKVTNFVFKVNGISDEDAERINAIESSRKIIDRMNEIFSLSRSVVFQGVKNESFVRNLMMVDTKMPEILAEALVISYRDNIKPLSKIVEILEEDNPLGFPGEGLYRHKFKRFLCSIALGVKPSDEWDGRDEANGGYIIVKKNGDVYAYHLHDRNVFEDYLLESTFFERASTVRHEYASLYRSENGRDMLLNLNLQVRFKVNC